MKRTSDTVSATMHPRPEDNRTNLLPRGQPHVMVSPVLDAQSSWFPQKGTRIHPWV